MKQPNLFDVDAVAPVVVPPVPEHDRQAARAVIEEHDGAAQIWKAGGASLPWFRACRRRARKVDVLALCSGASEFYAAAGDVVAIVGRLERGNSDARIEASIAKGEQIDAKLNAAIDRLRSRVTS